MNIERLMPIFAPAPPAIVLGLQLYNEIIRASGQEWWLLATFAAVLGTVGTIGVEMLSYKNALKAWAEREIGAMIVALVAALVASTLIVWVIWRSEDSRPLVAAIAIAIAGYLSMAVRDYMDKKKALRDESSEKKNAAKDLEIKLAHELRLKASAEARRAKSEASGVSGQPVRSVQRTTGQGLDKDKLEATINYLRAHPGATVRDLGGAGLGYSKSQAAIYRTAAEKYL
jgi:hypothetical protein